MVGLITRYRVEWDLTSDFKNVQISRTFSEFPVSPSSGRKFCKDIDISRSSTDVARFARVLSFNGFKWSEAASSSPRSAKGVISPPGAPVAVTAVATSSVGILVNWLAPNSDACEFGGDGGTPVTHYVVEWDLRSDFNSPASKETLYNPPALSFMIGGRDVFTGKESTVLIPDRDYYVRVTAFNGKGAGVAGYAFMDSPVGWVDALGRSCAVYAALLDARLGECTNGPQCGCGSTDNLNLIGELSYGVSADQACCACKDVCEILTVDTVPNAPKNVASRDSGVTSVFVSWETPVLDGGATIEKYRLEYSNNESFNYYSYVDLPRVSEVQTVVAESVVDVEVQALRLTVEVTNERQIIRTVVDGKDEIQTVTTTCDKVQNEVQRVTTTAIDINEVQTIEITGTLVHEVQLVQIITDDFPEVQIVDVSSARVSEVQRFGVIVTGVDTNSCTIASTCTAVEALITGTFMLQFEPEKCGTNTNHEDANWCVRALKDNSFSTGQYQCTDTTCLSIALSLTSADSDVKTAICDISNPTTQKFMTDANGDCVTVTRTSEALDVQTLGSYVLYYEVTFVGNYLRGNVPALVVHNTDVSLGAGFTYYSSHAGFDW